MTKRARLLGVALMMAVGLAACGGSSGPIGDPSLPSNVVAQVGSTPITKEAYDHWMEIAAQRHVPVPPAYTACIAYLRSSETNPTKVQAPTPEAQLKATCAKSYALDKQRTLSFLVSSQWLLGEAKEVGVSVSNKEVEQELDATKRQNYPTEADFKKYLQETGYTLPDLAFKTEMELLPPKIEQKIAAQTEKAITRPVISRYYEKHLGQYQRPESKRTLILLTQTEAKANAAKAEIQSGKSFASVAKRVTIFHTDEPGGVYMTVSRGQGELEPSVEAAVFSAKPGVVTGPVKASSGYYMFEVTKTTPAGARPLRQVGNTIGGKLSVKKIKAELERRSTASRRKWRAKTRCAPGYVTTYCSEGA
jgi:parvulin-like peptidyl-prolyl isomerase